ncbi:hypothetical protein [Haliangium sp.]|uniref:hypothetical protein n=1 Tax=Haliangium sp. TaxID=2663208 RepID=UPI003D129D1D
MTTRSTTTRCSLLVLALVLALAWISGCYRHQIVLQDQPPMAMVAQADVHKFYVLGFIGLGGAIPLEGFCPTGTAQIYQRAGLFHWLAVALSGGLVTSRSSLFLCSADGYGEGERPAGAPAAASR